jgi:ferredoxin--NADP+ reductase
MFGRLCKEVGGKMPKVVDNQQIGPQTWKMRVETPKLVTKAKAGQFVILRVNDNGERVPMSIAGLDKDKGLLTIVYQVVGKTSAQMTAVPAGGELSDCVGPLGEPSHVDNWGTVCLIGGGIGIAPIYPIAQAYKEAGNKVITIIGARSKDILFYESEHKAVADDLYICTDDGSYGQKGFVSDVLKKLLDDGEKIRMVMAIGPVPMMKVVSNLTKGYDVPTWVSLNPLMVDGTGMCGGCRVSIGGETKFACVDGPDFDGHKVDFDLLTSRLGAYKVQERNAMHQFLENPGCKLSKSVKEFKYPG